MAIATIVGSAFSSEPEGLDLKPVPIETPHGAVTLHRVTGHDAYLSFRHGLPHRLLPNQINYRAQAAALAQVGVKALLVTSSVGVLDQQVPLFRPLLVTDLLTLDNRLPDGSACTMFAKQTENQGHLVLEEGLFSRDLSDHIERLNSAPLSEVVFGYAPGPRTKTAAENRMYKGLGVQVNSMSLAPEVVLANELELCCAAVVVGHKYSLGRPSTTPDEAGIAKSLDDAKRAMETLIVRFLKSKPEVRFKNHIYRLGA